MYKDLLIQIVKYLKPKIVYYPILQIKRIKYEYSCYPNNFHFNFYLICEINGIVESETYIDTVERVLDGNYEFSIIKHHNNGNLYFLIGMEKYRGNRRLFYPSKLFFLDKNIGLKINHICVVNSSFGWLEYHTLSDYILEISKNYDDFPDIGRKLICSHKLNKESIKLIERGFEIIDKIGKSDPLKLEEKNFTEEEKKYIKIL